MGGGTSGGGDDDEMITAINVTPLVDVVLVLLIILMVTASYIVSKSIPLDLPNAASADGAPPRALAISIDREGHLFVDAEATDDAGLRTRARALVGEVGEAEARATIAADTGTSHGNVVHVMDLLRREHVTHFAINVSPEDLAEAP